MKPLFPYRQVFGDFNLNISDVRVDGEAPDVPVINLAVPEIDVRDVERKDWDHLDLELEVVAPVAGVARAEAEHAPIAVTVTLNDASTNSRLGVGLVRSVADPGLWSGSLRIPRGVVRAAATVEAVLTGTVDGFPCRILQRAAAWTVVFDLSVPRPVDGALPVFWADFEDAVDPKHPLLKRYEKEAFFVDLEADVPVVYLNSSLPHMLDVMGDRDRHDPSDEAMHHLQRSSLAARVWAALFQTAAAEAVRRNAELKPGEEPTWPDAWRRDVLTRLLGHVFESSTPDDALLKLIDAWRQPDGSALASEFTAAAETEAKAARWLLEAAEAVYDKNQEKS